MGQGSQSHSTESFCRRTITSRNHLIQAMLLTPLLKLLKPILQFQTNLLTKSYLDQCYLDQMLLRPKLLRQNVTQTKCYLYQMLLRPNVTYTKCYLDQMLLRPNVTQTKSYQTKCYQTKAFIKKIFFFNLLVFFRGKGISWFKKGMGSSKAGALDTLGNIFQTLKNSLFLNILIFFSERNKSLNFYRKPYSF